MFRHRGLRFSVGSPQYVGAGAARCVGMEIGYGALGAARRIHLVEADVQSDGAGHQQVVVTAGYRAVRSVGAPFVGEIFVETVLVPLRVQPSRITFTRVATIAGLVEMLVWNP